MFQNIKQMFHELPSESLAVVLTEQCLMFHQVLKLPLQSPTVVFTEHCGVPSSVKVTIAEPDCRIHRRLSLVFYEVSNSCHPVVRAVNVPLFELPHFEQINCSLYWNRQQPSTKTRVPMATRTRSGLCGGLGIRYSDLLDSHQNCTPTLVYLCMYCISYIFIYFHDFS